MLAGYETRLVSLALAIFVLLSAFIGHSHVGDLNQFQHFMKNMALIGGYLDFLLTAAALIHSTPDTP